MKAKPSPVASHKNLPSMGQHGMASFTSSCRRVSLALIPLFSLTLLASPFLTQAATAHSSSDIARSSSALPPVTEKGLASWYGGKKLAGKRTASGERFRHDDLTAAHPYLPLGTKLLIQAPSTGRSIIVRVNDRGPFGSNRILDLSKGAAVSLGIIHRGISQITVRVLPRNGAHRVSDLETFTHAARPKTETVARQD